MSNIRVKKKKSGLWRKSLILPAEHGSWAWLLVPFGVGVGVSGMVNTAVWLTFIGGFSLFLLRQPVTVWLRVQQGRARHSDGPLALTWVVILGVVALLCLAGLLWLERGALLWLLGPTSFVIALYLVAVYRRGVSTRARLVEVAGALGLAVMAPAVLVAATGQLTAQAWWLWGMMGLLNVMGALYVRVRIADTHQRPAERPGMMWVHIGSCVGVLGAALLSAVPRLMVVPFLALLLRAGWTAVAVRPVANVKRFGLIEVGVEVVGGVWVVLCYRVF